eukprot:7929481-Karenia_brevis.AAC.1
MGPNSSVVEDALRDQGHGGGLLGDGATGGEPPDLGDVDAWLAGIKTKLGSQESARDLKRKLADVVDD